ncbi:chromosome partitioning protein ParB [Corallococcus sp. Z5C101001]|nr:chromosome partitioning protein ParB [Corallococcus sp. Z5C101001]
MDAEHRAEGQEGTGENATPPPQEGASVPRHGEGVGGDVTSEGIAPSGAGGTRTDLPGEAAPASQAAQASSNGEEVHAQGAEVPAGSETDSSRAGPSGGEGGESSASAAGADGTAFQPGANSGSDGAVSATGSEGSASAGEGDSAGAVSGADATSRTRLDASSEAQGSGAEADAPTGPGRYVELSSGQDVPDASGAGSDGGGEAKDVLAEPRSGPVSGADEALLGAGIWDVASRASQEESGSGDDVRDDSEAGSDDDAATPEGEPPAEALAPRVMGQVTAMVLPLERLEEDTTFRLRDEGDVSELATDLARLGQLFPVDVRPRGEERYQLICGFRRVAALRFLKRDQVQVRVHETLSDEDALLLSLAEAIHASPVEHDVLEAKRDTLEAEGRLTAPVRDMLEKALATEETLAPEGVEEEIDADELAVDVAQRMGALNQDLSLLADVFAALDESRRAELLMQLRYSAQLVAYLEGL